MGAPNPLPATPEVPRKRQIYYMSVKLKKIVVKEDGFSLLFLKNFVTSPLI
jgi:hypothetical protein